MLPKLLPLFLLSLLLIQVNTSQATSKAIHLTQGAIVGFLCTITLSIINERLKELTRQCLLSNSPLKIQGAKYGVGIGMIALFFGAIRIPSLSRMITTRTRNRMQRNHQEMLLRLCERSPYAAPAA